MADVAFVLIELDADKMDGFAGAKIFLEIAFFFDLRLKTFPGVVELEFKDKDRVGGVDDGVDAAFVCPHLSVYTHAEESEN